MSRTGLRRMLPAIVLIAACLALALYFLRPRPSPAVPLPPATPAANAAADAVNAFGLHLFGALRTRPGNRAVSPYSVHAILSMAHQGAAGNTRQELAALLHLPPDPAAGQRDLHARLQSPGNHGFELAIANRLWLAKSFSIHDDFRRQIADAFLADAQVVDLPHPAAVDAINRWTREKTRNHISDIISPPLAREAVFILTNALYFKGAWETPFEESQTTEGDFHLTPDRRARTMFMRQRERHPYADFPPADGAPAFRALALDYAGGDLSMLLLLPNLGELHALEQAFTPALLVKTLDALQPREVPVTLPRFRIADAYSLEATLQQLGLKSAFDPVAADFAGIGSSPVWIDTVAHKCFVQVDEEGTTAAAASELGALQGLKTDDLEFNANRPFLFLIRDKSTGAILFLGRLADPS